MRSSNSGYAHGTTGSPQTTIEQEEYALKVAENEAALKEFADNLPLIDKSLIAEMEASGVKFTRENVMFATRDKTGQVIWLETGNPGAGYKHLQIRGHIEQLAKKFDVPKSEVVKLIRNIIRDGKIISNVIEERNGRKVCRREYQYDGKKIVLAAVGTNGFLVSIYPKSK